MTPTSNHGVGIRYRDDRIAFEGHKQTVLLVSRHRQIRQRADRQYCFRHRRRRALLHRQTRRLSHHQQRIPRHHPRDSREGRSADVSYC